MERVKQSWQAGVQGGREELEAGKEGLQDCVS